MLVAMGMAAVLCIAIGVFPQPLYALLPYPVDFEPYTGVHLTESLSLLMFTALGFVLFLRALEPENTISIDTDWFYRKGARLFMWFAEKPLARYEKAVSNVSETAALPFLHGTARAGLWIDLTGVDACADLHAAPGICPSRVSYAASTSKHVVGRRGAAAPGRRGHSLHVGSIGVGQPPPDA
jgi:hypothetical protein